MNKDVHHDISLQGAQKKLCSLSLSLYPGCLFLFKGVHSLPMTLLHCSVSSLVFSLLSQIAGLVVYLFGELLCH